MANLDAHRVADLLEFFPGSQQIGPSVRWALAHLAELGLEVVAWDGRPDGLERFPVAVDEKRFLAERVDVGAVLLVKLSDDIVHVH